MQRNFSKISQEKNKQLVAQDIKKTHAKKNTSTHIHKICWIDY